MAAELYTVRGSDGVEYGPTTLDKVQELVKQGKIKATTLIYTQRDGRWHLSASIAEIRSLLRKHNPSQDPVLDRIRALNSNSRDTAHTAMAVGRTSTIRMKRKSFWSNLFSR